MVARRSSRIVLRTSMAEAKVSVANPASDIPPGSATGP
jgi:hypothetical protein